MDESRAKRLLGTPERRIAVRDIEVRSGTGSTFVVRGYACVTDHPYDVYGGPERGGWTENVKRGAFDTTLAANPDVCFLINHDGMPLARTRSGTLALRADTTGLESEAVVDRRDPEGQALEVKMERGDLDQMSFGFRVTRQSWNEDYTERDITEVNLNDGDVSIVNWPANPATSMNIVSARSAVTVLREMEMAELRSQLGDITPEELRSAQERLGQLIQVINPDPTPTPVVKQEKREVITLVVDTDPSEDVEEDMDDGADDLAISTLLAVVAEALVAAEVINSVPEELGADNDGDEGSEDEDDEHVSALLDILAQILVKNGVIDSLPAESSADAEDEDDEQIAFLTSLLSQLVSSSRSARDYVKSRIEVRSEEDKDISTDAELFVEGGVLKGLLKSVLDSTVDAVYERSLDLSGMTLAEARAQTTLTLAQALAIAKESA